MQVAYLRLQLTQAKEESQAELARTKRDLAAAEAKHKAAETRHKAAEDKRKAAEVKHKVAEAEHASVLADARKDKSTHATQLKEEKQRNAALVEQLATTKKLAQSAHAGPCDAESVVQVHVQHAVVLCEADVPSMELLSKCCFCSCSC